MDGQIKLPLPSGFAAPADPAPASMAAPKGGSPSSRTRRKPPALRVVVGGRDDPLRPGRKAHNCRLSGEAGGVSDPAAPRVAAVVPAAGAPRRRRDVGPDAVHRRHRRA